MRLEPDHVLTRVTHYELLRAEDRIRLRVAEVVAGGECQFVAYPVDVLGKAAPLRFQITRATEQEALQACIDMVGKLPYSEVLPHDEMYAPSKK